MMIILTIPGRLGPMQYGGGRYIWMPTANAPIPDSLIDEIKHEIKYQQEHNQYLTPEERQNRLTRAYNTVLIA